MILVIGLFAPYLAAGYNDSSEVVFYGTAMIRWSIAGMFFINLSHIYNGACRGAGNVKVPMIVAIFSQVVIKYLFVWIGLQIFYDVHILYLATAVGYVFAGTLATAYFYSSGWSRQNGLR